MVKVTSSIVLSAATAWSLATNNGVMAFTHSKINHPSTVPSSSSAICAATNSRRDLFLRTGTTVVSTLLTTLSGANPAIAADSPPTPQEIERIKTGYANIQYLLANWDAETTVCRENGGECKRNADAVRRYLGLRSTTDPLFQIEKVFDKIKYMDDVDLEEVFEATEVWNTTMNMSNSMAFISQFAEYNPGGGKDEVLKYLNESKTQVILAEKALKKILDGIAPSA